MSHTVSPSSRRKRGDVGVKGEMELKINQGQCRKTYWSLKMAFIKELRIGDVSIRITIKQHWRRAVTAHPVVYAFFSSSGGRTTGRNYIWMWWIHHLLNSLSWVQVNICKAHSGSNRSYGLDAEIAGWIYLTLVMLEVRLGDQCDPFCPASLGIYGQVYTCS